MKQKDHTLERLAWTIAALLIAGVVHIVSILLMPSVATRDAYHRLLAMAATAQATQGGVALLDPASPSAPSLPFVDPATAQGVCLFDLADGPFHLQAGVDGENYLGLSFHSATDVIFHAMTDRGATKGRIAVVIGDAQQIEDMEDNDSDNKQPQETRVAAPSRQGFVLIRALAKRPSDRGRAQESVKAVRCETLKRQE